MSTKFWQRLRVVEPGRRGLAAAWYSLDVAALEVRFGDEVREIGVHFPEMIIHATKDALGEAVEVSGCVNCIHYEQSGMSREMGTALQGQCEFHGEFVDLFFQCEQYRSQDCLRPDWEIARPDLKSVAAHFAKWSGAETPFIVYQNGTILMDDPDSERWSRRGWITVPALINVLPAMRVEAHDEFYLIEHWGFVFSIVSHKEWAEHGARVCAEIAADRACEAAVREAGERIRIPEEHAERAVAFLAWNRLVRDSRGGELALVQRGEG
jgi:hypothetical protein